MTREEYLAQFAAEKVFEKVDGENDNITWRPVDDNGVNIPVATKNHGREENHYVFNQVAEVATPST